MWKPASQPPGGRVEKWTTEVVCITNFGNVFILMYFNGKADGKLTKYTDPAEPNPQRQTRVSRLEVERLKK